MGYTLHSGLTAGAVRHDGDRHEIRDGELEAGDYDTAAALVDTHGHLYWPDGDPQPVAAEPDPDDGGDGGEDSDGGDGDAGEPVDFDADYWLDADYEDRAERVRSGEVDAKLDAIEAVERSSTVENAIDARRDELEG